MSLIFLPSYLIFSFTEEVSISVIDGWCPEKSTGIGQHCFGDFFYNFTVANTISPWNSSAGIPYPPLSVAFSKPFMLLANLLSSQISLYVNIAVSLIALSFPLTYMQRKFKVNGFSFWHQLLILFLMTPIISLLDRGNNLFVTFPLLFIFYFSVLTSNKKLSVVVFVVLCLFRPQFILLILIFLFKHGFLYFIKISMLTLISVCLSFFLYPQNYLVNIVSWIRSLFSYNSIAEVIMPWPTKNYSLVGSIDLFNYIIEHFFDFRLFELNSTLLQFFLLTVTLVLMYFYRFYLSDFEIITIAVFLIILLPGTTYFYYLSLLVIPIFFVLNHDLLLKSRISLFSTSSNCFMKKLPFYLLAISFLPLMVPQVGYLEGRLDILFLSKFSGLVVLISFLFILFSISLTRLRKLEVEND